MKLEVGQELSRTKNDVGDTCVVVYFRSSKSPSFFSAIPVDFTDLVELSNGERVDPEGWYFDPANPSAWRVVEKPEPVKARSLDEVFEDVLRLGGDVAIDGRSSCTLAVETLRAELKALFEDATPKCDECGEPLNRCDRHDDPGHGEDI